MVSVVLFVRQMEASPVILMWVGYKVIVFVIVSLHCPFAMLAIKVMLYTPALV